VANCVGRRLQYVFGAALPTRFSPMGIAGWGIIRHYGSGEEVSKCDDYLDGDVCGGNRHHITDHDFES
jgi:hypothetical protein